jgi:hypothetical protein
MALKDLHDFLVALSKHQSLREEFAKDSAKVGSDAGLTKTEIDLLNNGTESQIREHLGDEFGAASMIKVKP